MSSSKGNQRKILGQFIELLLGIIQNNTFKNTFNNAQNNTFPKNGVENDQLRLVPDLFLFFKSFYICEVKTSGQHTSLKISW